MISPIGLEQNLKNLEKKVAEFLAAKKLFLPVAFLFSLLFCWFCYPFWSQAMPAWSRFFIAQDRVYGVFTLLAGFFISMVLPRNWRPAFHLLILLAAWLIPCFFLKVFRPIIWGPIIYLAVNAVVLRRPRPGNLHKFLSAFVVLGTFAVLVWALGWDAETSRDYRFFRFFWTLHLEILTLFFLAQSFQKSSLPFSISLNPLQLISPMTWPPEMKLESDEGKQKYLRALGFFQLIVAQVIFWILLIVVPHIPVTFTPVNSILHYTVFVFFAMAALGVVSAFVHLFGYQAPDATYFMILAKSPLEIWQRGSTYTAQFFFRNIYFPIWVRSRRTWLAASVLVLAIFFNLYLFHDFFLRELLRWVAPTLPVIVGTAAQTFVLPALWMLSWLIWILAFHFMTRIFAFLRTGWGLWIAVLLTHLGSSQMFGVARLLGAWLGISFD
jgi:hypothetical protein